MSRVIDLTGQRFGRLTVVNRAENYINPSGGKRSTWNCLCDCGKEVVARSAHLSSGATQSCGCLGRQRLTEGITSHGLSHNRLYGVWNNMKNRCYNENVKCYSRYGGRGIKVCAEWLNDFKAFYDWCMSAGYDDSAPYMQCTIDRADNNGNYTPDNCRFASAKVQANNRRKPEKRCAV